MATGRTRARNPPTKPAPNLNHDSGENSPPPPRTRRGPETRRGTRDPSFSNTDCRQIRRSAEGRWSRHVVAEVEVVVSRLPWRCVAPPWPTNLESRQDAMCLRGLETWRPVSNARGAERVEPRATSHGEGRRRAPCGGSRSTGKAEACCARSARGGGGTVPRPTAKASALRKYVRCAGRGCCAGCGLSGR